MNVAIAAIAFVGDQLGGTQNGDYSQKTARGQLKGCIVPKAFDICNHVIIYPVEVYCSRFRFPIFFDFQEARRDNFQEKIVLKATRKMANSLKLKRSNYLESMKIEP